MSWDERQRAMLAAMGLRVWSAPALALADAEPEPQSEPEMIAAPAARPVAEPAMSAPAPAPRSIASLLPAALRPAQAPLARRAGEEGEGADAARRQSIAAMGWDELAASVAGCRACQLCE
ncbi:MAG: hypothetical protein ABW005_11960, partial [Burkholderiaceae bacterium]